MGMYVQSNSLGIEPVTTALIAQQATGLLKKLLSKGHDDDAVDQAEEDILFQFIQPILREMFPSISTGRTWGSTRQAANTPASQSPLTAAQAQQLIQQGDAIISQACASFAQAGFPCQPAPPGKRSSGAGRDIKPLWDAVRSKLQQIAAQGGGGGIFSQLIPGGDGTTASSLLPWGVAAAGLYFLS